MLRRPTLLRVHDPTPLGAVDMAFFRGAQCEWHLVLHAYIASVPQHTGSDRPGTGYAFMPVDWMWLSSPIHARTLYSYAQDACAEHGRSLHPKLFQCTYTS